MNYSLNIQERMRLNHLYDLDPEHGRNTLLDNYMKRRRRDRDLLPKDKEYELYINDNFIQLWFQTRACRYSLSGKCTICNYWNGSYIPGLVKRMVKELDIPAGCHTLLINTCGSCLDPVEVPHDELILLLEWIESCPAKRIIFETHQTSLTRNTLSLIREILPNKEIFYEIGIESANPDSLFYMLNKPSSLTDISSITERVHGFGAKCIMNAILGLPFLNPEEQINDAVRTIRELLDNNSDYVVLFPVNIKPHTLIMDLYKTGQYFPVPVRIIADILIGNFQQELDRIDIAWFGDRSEDGVIPPKSCDICGERIIDLLKHYNNAETTEMRSSILRRATDIKCGCKEEYFSSAKAGTLYERINKYYKELLNGSEK